MGLGIILLLAGGAFLLFGTHTTVAVMGPDGLQTGGPNAAPGAQHIAAGVNPSGQQSTVAQNIASGQGNSIAQDISAGAGALSGVAGIIKNFNIGGGATTVPANSPNDQTGGTQAQNNSANPATGQLPIDAFSLNDPSSSSSLLDDWNSATGDASGGGTGAGYG